MAEKMRRPLDKLKQDAKAYVAFQRARDREERYFLRGFHAAFRARKEAEGSAQSGNVMVEEDSPPLDKLKQDAKAYVAFQRAIDREERWFKRGIQIAVRARKMAERNAKPESPGKV